MQDIQKDKFSEEENDYSHKENIYKEVKTAFGGLDKNRKIVVIFLVFFSFSFFIFWAVSTKKTIKNQLNPSINTESGIEYDLLGGGGDDSRFNYGEIDRDLSDITCPPGQDCRLYNVYDEQSQSDPNLLIGENINFGTPDTSNINEDIFINIIEGGVSVQELREMLISAGMNKEILDSISDEDLIQSYKEILQ